MAQLTSIPIECWVCGQTYRVPATLSIFPPALEETYRDYWRKVSADVWIHIDQDPIKFHLSKHWPVLVVGFFLWHAFREASGVDIFGYLDGWCTGASDDISMRSLR